MPYTKLENNTASVTLCSTEQCNEKRQAENGATSSYMYQFAFVRVGITDSFVFILGLPDPTGYTFFFYVLIISNFYFLLCDFCSLFLMVFS